MSTDMAPFSNTLILPVRTLVAERNSRGARLHFAIRSKSTTSESTLFSGLRLNGLI